MSIHKRTLINLINYQNCFVFFFALSMVGLLYSRFLLSLSYALFGGLMIYSIVTIEDLKSNLKSRATFWFLAITLLWFIFAISGFWSENIDYWLDKLRIKLPLLLFPLFAFFTIKVDRPTWNRILLIFIFLTCLSTIELLLNIFQDRHHIKELLAAGGVFKTPINHIRYSMLLCLAAQFSIIMSVEDFLNVRIWRLLLLVVSAYLIVLLHILAVRTGLIGFYMMLIIYIIHYSIKNRSYRYLVFLAYLGIIPIFALKLPSVQAKIDYIKESLFFQREGHSGNLYSDSDRLLSMKVAMEVNAKTAWFGVGAGDMFDRMKEGYKKYPDRDRILMPHNQFIAYYLASGIVGLILMSIALAICFWGCKLYDDSILFVHFIYLLFSASFETTFDISIGIALFIYPLFAGIVHHFGLNSKANSTNDHHP